MTKKIWIDLDNTPHVPLFAPIIEELHARGFEVVVTARDAFQVRDLLEFHALEHTLVGRHYGKNFWLKLLGVGMRAIQLLPIALRERPALAISHGSRSQLTVSWLLGIPSLMITDYEHAKTFAVISPTWIMVPDVIPVESIHAARSRILQYPGIKEDVYVPRFKPDSSIRARLGLSPGEIVVTIRPPATEAHYHNPEGEDLFRHVVEHLSADSRVRMIVLPRNEAQAHIVRRTWPDLIASSKMILPDQVEDGLNLIWYSDFVISGGGTMNREAAALGVKVYSIFRGPLGAVDRFLAAQGRLVVIASASEVRSKIALVPRDRDGAPPTDARATMGAIVRHIHDILATALPVRHATEAR
jgi:predicted glycosyltransferase